MFVWDHCSPSSIEFKSSLEPIAHIIENDFVLNALDRVTDELVEKQDNLEVIYSASIKTCELPAKENEDECARFEIGNFFWPKYFVKIYFKIYFYVKILNFVTTLTFIFLESLSLFQKMAINGSNWLHRNHSFQRFNNIFYSEF